MLNIEYGPLTGPPSPNGTTLLACSTGGGCGLRWVAVGCGTGFFLAFFSAIGIASLSSTIGCGCDFDNPLDSVASTFCVCTGFAGSGTLLTSETPMALPPPPSPQFDPRRPVAIHAYATMATVTPTCNAADHARLGPQRSCSKKI